VEATTNGLTSIERRALEALDVGGLVALLRELIAIPSLDGEESPAQRAVAAWLRGAGLSVDEWEIDLDGLAAHPDWCHEVERDEARGVVGWTGESRGGRDLMLNGHIDVVPAGELSRWTAPPYRADVRDGCVFGRGAVDMKGGLCCALAALRAVHDAGIRLRGRLSVASVVGEEDGGTGTLATLLRGHTAHGAVITEPTRLRLVTAQAGSLMFRLTVPGLSAHACVREEGVSAVEKFVPLLAALRRLEAERCGAPAAGVIGPGGALASVAVPEAGGASVAGDPHGPLFSAHRLPWPIEIGTLSAGDWASSVPDMLTAEGRYGVAVGEDPAQARRVLEDAVARAAATDAWLSEHPPRVEWWGGRFDPAETAPDDPVAVAVSAAAVSVLGDAPPVEGVTYGADMRLLVGAGHIPTVMFGPGDVRVAHMPDEHVPLVELEAAARTLVVAALRFCGAEDRGSGGRFLGP
jgi:acetylornithine deacetylase